MSADDLEAMLPYFPAGGSAPHGAVRPLFSLVAWANAVQEQTVPDFFAALADQLAVCFGATLVTLWDYSAPIDSLILLASTPARTSLSASHVIPASNSLTGTTVRDKTVVVRDVSRPSVDGRSFANPSISNEMGLRVIYSAPVFSPGNRSSVRYVLNICYDEMRPFPITREHFQHSADLVGLCIEHRLDRRAIHIRKEVSELAPKLAGLRSLYNAIEKSLCSRTNATIAQLFRVSPSQNELYPEGENNLPDGSLKFAPDELAEIGAVCVRDRRTLMRAERSGSLLECHLIAAPVMSGVGRVVAVLACKAPVAVGGRIETFSSVDLHALQTFAFLLAPSVQRFIRVREGGALPFIRRIFEDLGNAAQEQPRLQTAVQIITKGFGCELGSVYLKEGPDDLYVMRAAFGRNHRLIHVASYRSGEGLTGSVAKGEIVNLRSPSEIATRARQSRNQWSGKFDESIWGGDARERLTSLLALPIRLGDTIIGVLKLANIKKTRLHPDAFFSDEDLQVAQILTWFLAHLVRLEHAETARLDAERRRYRDFRLLAATSLAMQKTTTEADAIAELLAALEKIDIEGVAVALTRPDESPVVALCSGSMSEARAEGLVTRAMAGEGRQEILETHLSDSGRIASSILPLRHDNDTLGYLCVDSSLNSDSSDGGDALILRAFAAQLQESLARIRATRAMREAADEAATRHRFMIADAVAVVAVHRIRHTLSHAKLELTERIATREVREHRVVLDYMRDLERMVNSLEEDLTSALQIVRREDEEGRFDLVPIIDAVIRRWNDERRGQCPVTLLVDASATTSSLNPDSTREILNILFVNARQAHAKAITVTVFNPPPLEIAIEGRAAERERQMYIRNPVCIEVTDNGHGFGGDLSERIFDPAFTTKHRRAGTGLGLFVARLLTRRAGGELQACRANTGSSDTTFRVYLPTFRRAG